CLGSFSWCPGRGEKIDTGLGFTCVIDYAHTPDALFNLFSAERELTRRNLICVFGAGGDRDEGKRPEMGKAAAALCDIVILTSDNPRSEKPEVIINDIAKGINGKKVTIEIDRKKAIEVSIAMAQKGDTVIIAGKGHEMYQEIMGKRILFSDREIVEDFIRKRKKGKDESK
ncbi:MAG: UDP-N-acetylmuramoyl-L-alanyl-D-glutamate--2,6-diaminopimelate ligase, partial [Candidatus Cloacimonadota bacterium]